MLHYPVIAKLLTEPFKNKIYRAYQNPILLGEIEETQENEQKAATKYLLKEINYEKFSEKLNSLKAHKPSLICHSLNELEMVLICLKVDSKIQLDTLKDMDFKIEEAIRNGFLFRIAIWFYQSVKKGTAMFVAVQIFVK